VEVDPTRMCELLVGLGDVEVVGVDDEVGLLLRVHVRCQASRLDCGACGGRLWSDGEKLVELVDLPAFGRPVRLVWHQRRWRCPNPECPAPTASERNPAIAPPWQRPAAPASR